MKILDMKTSYLLDQIKKPTANPGGGSLVILVGLMGLKLLRMMDKKNYEALEDQAVVSRETLDGYEEELALLVEEDIARTKDLIVAYKSGAKIEEDLYIKAASPQIKAVDILTHALKASQFILKYGKKTTLSDGIIANNLMVEAVRSALPTIEINLKNTQRSYDYKGVLALAKTLGEENEKIIEGRK
ncbi:MAG: cyclodeaminase/cyclohydrolase family protein [Anaerococcus sp.]|nr:cyclodeaminase/cyclohydrolase family protein [Anaerococcus sp.]